MINHYVNLVYWRDMLEIYERGRDNVWVDSVSLKVLLDLFKAKFIYRPGTEILKEAAPDGVTQRNWFFLTAKFEPNIESAKQKILPIFKDCFMADDVIDELTRLPSGTKIAIGISSPKQNYLAAQLYLVRPDLEYYCLGAALGNHFSQNSVNKFELSGTGMEWINFLIRHPWRTSQKLYATVLEAFALLASDRARDKFKLFIIKCLEH